MQEEYTLFGEMFLPFSSTSHKQWQALVNTVLTQTCYCPKITKNLDCPWCFKNQGCERIDCPILLHCEYPQCQAESVICQECFHQTDHCGWHFGIRETDKMIALFCPQHPKKRGGVLYIKIM